MKRKLNMIRKTPVILIILLYGLSVMIFDPQFYDDGYMLYQLRFADQCQN